MTPVFKVLDKQVDDRATRKAALTTVEPGGKWYLHKRNTSLNATNLEVPSFLPSVNFYTVIKTITTHY